MKKKWIVPVMLMLVLAMLLTACDKKLMFVGSESGSKVKASYKLFSGTDDKKVKLKSGETLAVDYKSKVEKGELTIELYDPDGELVKDFNTGEAGSERIEADKDGAYKFIITGKSAKGSYEIKFTTE
ncbi:hypothetical protein R70723_23090 [Paenibacillus sp. FSL R7-0273]|uniref:hypothetical protein n=1 Tax=Paenibacillus sp. FSL R7-0273 TaxID=1536772 RepID=UPI0004F64F64|nr:hypothetical protein [Paenibacillus sp. FSL R7-0273]AIQ48477.1 hypothetical protein R70723_23090 [Paenibacillus sp. FSL R7-0273]OMF86310.1 hypothetical protein BK144_26305 [Paenibacillus sp. FSL R7-0273]